MGAIRRHYHNMVEDLNFSLLVKAMARAASDNDGESLVALRMVRRMLEKAGLDFVDLANVLAGLDCHPQAQELTQLQDELRETRRKLREMRGEARRLRTAISPPMAEAQLRREVDHLHEEQCKVQAELEAARARIDQLTQDLSAALAAHHREVNSPPAPQRNPFANRFPQGGNRQYSMF
jgi:septal ring factor EnvC (AmiA/AmiB activator)